MRNRAKDWTRGNRGTHKGKRCTVIDASYAWIDGDYIPVKIKIEYDDDKRRLWIKANELVDDLRYRWTADGWNHGYSWCNIYGIEIKDLLALFDSKDPDGYEYMNIQEEIDGCISFYAYRIVPDDVVDMFKYDKNIFVFANWHWDGDIFACTDETGLKCQFTRGPEDGDEEDWIMADMVITARNGQYSFEIGAGDFSEDEIAIYERMG